MLPPRSLFLALCAVLAVACLASVHGARDQPWLGVSFAVDANPAAGLRVQEVAASGPAHGNTAPGDRWMAIITADGQRLDLDSALLRVNPGTLETWVAYDEFIARLDALHQAAREGPLTIETADGRLRQITPLPLRPVSELPLHWWLWLLRLTVVVVLVSGLLAFLPPGGAVTGFALAGFASAATSLALLPLEGRELFIDPQQMLGLHRSLWMSHAFYGCALAVMLWHYPRPLPGRHAAWGLYLVYAGAWWIYFERIWPDPVGLQALVSASGLLVIMGLLVWQWRSARPASAERRAVRWFGLCIGGSLLWFAGFLSLPMTLRANPVFSTEWIEMGVFLSFLALGLGIYRQRLLQVDRWLLRVWALLLVTALIVAADLVLILWLDLDSALSLGLTLAAVAWVYLPLRAWLWRGLWQEKTEAAALQNRLMALETGLRGVPDAEMNAGWRQLLHAVFKPLQCLPDPDAGDTARLSRGGRELRVPALPGQPGWRLVHAEGGTRLFRPADMERVALLHRWVLRACAHRQAVEEGALQERSRFAADLHDGAVPPLLSLIYRSRDHALHPQITGVLPRLRHLIRAIADDAPSP